MIKRINEVFDIKEHQALQEKKEELRKELGRDRLNWHDYILHISGVNKL